MSADLAASGSDSSVCRPACIASMASQRDLDSMRQIAVNCPSAMAPCGYDQTCQLTTTASCVSCGSAGNRIGFRSIDGVVSEDCLGCSCSAWKVYGCYAETASYGAPWADIVWQVGARVLRFAVTTTGSVNITGKQPQDNLAVLNPVITALEVSPGGAVDLELQLTNDTMDNFGTPQHWVMHGRVVDACH
jgi:hypothetical protein